MPALLLLDDYLDLQGFIDQFRVEWASSSKLHHQSFIIRLSQMNSYGFSIGLH